MTITENDLMEVLDAMWSYNGAFLHMTRAEMTNKLRKRFNMPSPLVDGKCYENTQSNRDRLGLNHLAIVDCSSMDWGPQVLSFEGDGNKFTYWNSNAFNMTMQCEIPKWFIPVSLPGDTCT
jgi:hypothetical protein